MEVKSNKDYMKDNELFKINPAIKKTINRELKKIEKEHNINILFAVESGSRAWGFPSTDSDYDVRFMFKYSLKEYLSIKKLRDTLSFPLEDDLDICGWDIKKVLQHILKSSAVMFEWLQSPIVYMQQENFRKNLWNISRQYFSHFACLSHYLGICRKYSSDLAPEVKIKIKKIFYVLRPLYAAKWICTKKSVPPMIFQHLTGIIDQDENIQENILTLLNKKFESHEKTLIRISRSLIDFIHETARVCETQKKQFSKSNFSSKKLDRFFYQLISGD